MEWRQNEKWGEKCIFVPKEKIVCKRSSKNSYPNIGNWK